MSWSARVTLNDSEGAVGERSASRRLLSHACDVSLSLRHFFIRGAMPSARQSLRRCETMSAALPRLPPLVGVRRTMASKIQGQEPFQGSGELILRARAGGLLDARQHIDLCVRVSGGARVRHVEEHGVRIDGALEDGKVVDADGVCIRFPLLLRPERNLIYSPSRT